MAEKFYSNLHQGDESSAYSEMVFQVKSILRKVNTCAPVKVTAVNASGVAPVGFLDCQVMVSQLTGNDAVVTNPAISNVPYFRLQGGKNAVIIDPQVGDIGIACFCQRDISAVKATRNSSQPGSHRTFSFSDAVYVGGILNGTPSQYIKFDNDGIMVFSPAKITCQAPQIILEGGTGVTIDTPVVKITGQMIQTGAKGSGATTSGGLTNTGGTISSNGVVLETHVHSGVSSGSSNTGKPV